MLVGEVDLREYWGEGISSLYLKLFGDICGLSEIGVGGSERFKLRSFHIDDGEISGEIVEAGVDRPASLEICLSIK